MGDDTPARARRVLTTIADMRSAGYNADPGAWDSCLSPSIELNATRALIALAAAVGRLVDERRKRGSDPWYLQFGWNDDAYMPCIGCELMNLDAQTGDHAPDCPALAIDRAFADLAALADDDGEVGE